MIVQAGATGGTRRDVTFNLMAVLDPRSRAAFNEMVSMARDLEIRMRDLRPGGAATRQDILAFEKLKKDVQEASMKIMDLTNLINKMNQEHLEKIELLVKANAREREAIAGKMELAKQSHEAEIQRIRKEADRNIVESKRVADAEIADAKRVAQEKATAESKQAAAAVEASKKVQSEKTKEAALNKQLGRPGLGGIIGGSVGVASGLVLTGMTAQSYAKGEGSSTLGLAALGMSIANDVHQVVELYRAIQEYRQAIENTAQVAKAAKAVSVGDVAGAVSTAGVVSEVAGVSGAAGTTAGTGAAGTAAAVGGAGLLSTILAAAAALASVVSASIVVTESLNGTAKAGEGLSGQFMKMFSWFTDQWPDLSNMLADIAQVVSPAALPLIFADPKGFGTRVTGKEEVASLEEQVIASGNRIGQKQRMDNYFASIRDAAERKDASLRNYQIRSAMESYAAVQFGATDQEKLLANRTQQLDVMGRRSDLSIRAKYSDSNNGLSLIERDIADLSRNRISLLHEEYSLVQSIAEKSLDGSNQRLKSLQDQNKLLEDQKKIQEEIAKEAANRYMTGKERFGNLDQGEQRRLIEVQQAFQYADRLEQSGSRKDKATAEAIRANIPMADRQKLSSLGLDAGVRFNRRAAFENADRNGFNSVFGGEEIVSANNAANRAREISNQQSGINIGITNEHNVQVNINSTLAAEKNAIRQMILNENAIQQAASDNRMRQIAEEEFRKALEANNKRLRDETEAARAKEIGRGRSLGG